MRLIDINDALQAVDKRIAELNKHEEFRKKADDIDVLGVKKWINNISTIEAIPIPKGVTNGDMIKNLYPYILTTEDNLTGQDVVVVQANGTIMVCLKDWWNAPYKENEDATN